ncbi:MAG TPA: hypothetical protein VGT02_10660 [Methylomirabilota bacterium]|nr:hypothetical protein [Methylomirabilota bacterium]
MCAPVDFVVLLGGVVAALAACAVALRVRAVQGQRGITITESIVVVAIGIVLAAIAFVIFWACPVSGIAGDAAASPLPSGAYQFGKTPPGAPPPACQSGTLCVSPGRFCPVIAGRCGDTYWWDTGTAQWTCRCRCRWWW